jgi:hypothetical protein
MVTAYRYKRIEAVSKSLNPAELSRLKEFNCRVLLAISDNYSRDQVDKSSGHAYHPNSRKVMLRKIQEDLRLDGLDETIKKYAWFTNWEG